MGDDARPLRVIDADVHHGSLNMVAALQPHLSPSYREQLEENGYVSGIGPFANDGGVRGWRAADVPAHVPAQQPPGGAVAWDIETTSRRLLQQRRLEFAILTGGPVYGAAAMPDLDYASAICRALGRRQARADGQGKLNSSCQKWLRGLWSDHMNYCPQRS